MFSFGVGVADDRALPFDPYLRTLPAGTGPRMVGRIITASMFALLGLVPLRLTSVIFTAADPSLPRLVAGVAMLMAAGLPFLMLGLFVGYRLTAKARSPSCSSSCSRWRSPVGCSCPRSCSRTG